MIFSTVAGPDDTGWVWQYSWTGQSQPLLEAVKRNYISRFGSTRNVKKPKSLCKYLWKVLHTFDKHKFALLSLANLGRSYQAYDVYLTPDWVVRKGKGCFLSQFGDWEVSCLPCWALNFSAVNADISVGNPCHPHSLGSGQRCREATEIPKGTKFIKRFTSEQETAVVFLPWRRVSFTATTCLLCHQHINISHEYSGSTMKWLFLKTMVISKPTNYIETSSSQKKGGKNTSFCSRSEWFLNVGWSWSGSLPESSLKDQTLGNCPSHFGIS